MRIEQVGNVEKYSVVD